MVRANGTIHSHDFTAVNGYTKIPSKQVLMLAWGSCPLGHNNCQDTAVNYATDTEGLNPVQITKTTTSNGFSRPNKSSHNHEHTPKRLYTAWTQDYTGTYPASCPSGHSKCIPNGPDGHTWSLPSIWNAELATYNTTTETRPRVNEKGHQHDTRWESFNTIAQSFMRINDCHTCPAGHANCVFTYDFIGHLSDINEITGTSEMGFG